MNKINKESIEQIKKKIKALQWLYEFNLDSIKSLHEIMERAYVSERSENIERFKSLDKRNMSEDNYSLLRSMYDSQFNELSTTIPNMGRISLFISIYSLSEISLNKLYKLLREVWLKPTYPTGINPLKIGDLRDSGIKGSLKLLKQICFIHLPEYYDLNSKQLKFLSLIRNISTHNHGEILKEQLNDIEKIKKELTKYQDFYIDIVENVKFDKIEDHYNTYLKEEFLENAIKWFEAMINELHNIALKKMDSRSSRE